MLASAAGEGIILTARELFVLIALVAIFAWVAYEVVKASRR
jgi:hypothetical protein